MHFRLVGSTCLLALVALTACTGGGGASGATASVEPAAYQTTITVTDTDGNPIPGAVATPAATASGSATLSVEADDAGRVRLDALREP
jgi:hypothetical protein